MPEPLAWVPVATCPDLLAPPVRSGLRGSGLLDRRDVEVALIDPDVADTAQFVERYDVTLEESANCVVVGGRRGDDERIAACLVLATDRADVNGLVRRVLGVRKCSFLGTDEAVARTGMAYGGITPFGLPDGWRVLVDDAVAARRVVVGSGTRGAKLRLPGELLAGLPSAEVVPGLGRAAAAP
jgi:prolyl-tRNA editing enzyme YbaK/EbsC (Cys-tRNA(Pro) deacylase)